jgi:PKHD-type hydroxylase
MIENEPAIEIFPSILDDQTVDWILSIENNGFRKGQIGQSGHEREDLEYRSVNASSINTYEQPKLVSMIRHFVDVFNSSNYCYDVCGINQIDSLHYTPGGRYNLHQDNAPWPERVQRKFSVIVQLTDSSEYTGGDLWIPLVDERATPEQLTMRREKGTVIIFPSWLEHQISPLESGERRSIVAWATGKGDR